MTFNLSSIKGNTSAIIDGVETHMAIDSLESDINKYKLVSLYSCDNTTVVELESVIQNDMNAEWVKKYT